MQGRRIAIVVALAAVGGCRPAFDLADREDIFAMPGDKHVMCAASIEWTHVDRHVIAPALDRARDDHTIVQLFAHDPGVTIDVDRIETTLDDAEARGLAWVTYRDLAAGVPREAGLALSFDDWYVDDWAALGDTFRRHHARVTFFVADYDTLAPKQRDELRALAADGHDIEYHSTRHQNAPQYVRDHGLDAYLADDIEPGLAAMRADGWDPIVFAYPLGHRTPAIDRALLQSFALLRGVMRECPKSEHEAASDTTHDLGDQIDEPAAE